MLDGLKLLTQPNNVLCWSLAWNMWVLIKYPIIKKSLECVLWRLNNAYKLWSISSCNFTPLSWYVILCLFNCHFVTIQKVVFVIILVTTTFFEMLFMQLCCLLVTKLLWGKHAQQLIHIHLAIESNELE
jgi:hypothetical protein